MPLLADARPTNALVIVPLNSALSDGVGSRYQPLESFGSALLLPEPMVKLPVRGFPSAGAVAAGAPPPPNPLPAMEMLTCSVDVPSERLKLVITRAQFDNAASTAA